MFLLSTITLPFALIHYNIISNPSELIFPFYWTIGTIYPDIKNADSKSQKVKLLFEIINKYITMSSTYTKAIISGAIGSKYQWIVTKRKNCN